VTNGKHGKEACNDEVQTNHQNTVKAWEAERDLAKEEKRKPQWTKPKQGLLEKPVPRPKKPDNDSELEEEEEEPEDDDAIDG
jgi:hypothetical protein